MGTNKSGRPREKSAKVSGPQEQPSETPTVGNETSTENVKKPPKKKYKYTRQLMRIALDDGMTQDEIAIACRTHQSVVSKWKSGESRGTEQQLAVLIKRYGSRLNRTTARVYLTMNDPDARWENTKFGRGLLDRMAVAQQLQTNKDPDAERQLQEDLSAMLKATRHTSDHWGPHQARIAKVLDAYQVIFASIYPTKIVQVEGPIVFRYSFCRLEGRLDRRGVDVARIPVSRWSVHDGQRGKFILVRQYRLTLLNEKQDRWKNESEQVGECLSKLWESYVKTGNAPRLLPSYWLDSAEDAAKWVCRIETPMTLEELLHFTDSYIEDKHQIHNPHDERALPFLLRKSLVEQGHQVPEVEKISGYE